MDPEPAEDYEAGLAALATNAFAEAFRLLKKVDDSVGLSAEGLEKLSEAAFWSGHPDESLEARERAYGKYLADEKPLDAGSVALTLARDLWDRNDMVVGGSWFSRAEKLLEGATETRQFGYLELMRGFMTHYSGDEEGAMEHARSAEQLAIKHSDKDLQGLSLIPQAMALIHSGDVPGGIRLIDEATIAAVSGDLKPEVTGAIYCSTIGICRELADYRRAAEWTDAAERWCKRTSIAGFPGICRVHRAEIMSLRGAWLEAEQEAVKAADELAKYGSAETISESFKEIGLIRLRMGDLAGAEDAFDHAHELYRAPQPGLALLRLAQGNPDAAMSSIKAALEEETWNRLARARLLPAMVEIARATGDLEVAKRAESELQQIAKDFGSIALSAAASNARAIVHQMMGSHDEAVRSAREARKLWLDVGAPYEAARARMLVGEAMISAGDVDLGKMELRAAMSNLEKLGALLDARRAAELISGEKERSAPKMTEKTFMFTDIVGSTDLVQLIGDDAWSNLLRWHDQALRSVIAEHKGEEVKQVGDGFFVAFDDARTAISCAVAIQQKLTAHRREHGFAPQVRIGLHVASALDLDGDYGGGGVHEAARIGAVATAGEVVVSAATISGLDIPTDNPRTVNLKGIAEPVEILNVVWSPEG